MSKQDVQWWDKSEEAHWRNVTKVINKTLFKLGDDFVLHPVVTSYISLFGLTKMPMKKLSRATEPQLGLFHKNADPRVPGTPFIQLIEGRRGGFSTEIRLVDVDTFYENPVGHCVDYRQYHGYSYFQNFNAPTRDQIEETIHKALTLLEFSADELLTGLALQEYSILKLQKHALWQEWWSSWATAADSVFRQKVAKPLSVKYMETMLGNAFGTEKAQKYQVTNIVNTWGDVFPNRYFYGEGNFAGACDEGVGVVWKNSPPLLKIEKIEDSNNAEWSFDRSYRELDAIEPLLVEDGLEIVRFKTPTTDGHRHEIRNYVYVSYFPIESQHFANLMSLFEKLCLCHDLKRCRSEVYTGWIPG